MANPEPERQPLLVEIAAVTKASPPLPTAVEPPRMPPLKTIVRDQMVFCPVVVEDLLKPEHPARALWELVGGLDLSGFYAHIKSVAGVAGRTLTILVC